MKMKTFREAMLDAQIKTKVDKFNGVPEKTYPKFLKNIFCFIALIIALLGFLLLFFHVAVGLFFLIPACLIFLSAKSMKTKDDIIVAAPVTSSGSLITEEFFAAGVSYYEKNIMKLAVRNDSWRKQTKTLLADGKAGKSIFRYNFINKPVKLIPEPKNEHDRNAVMIQIAGEKVGYIRAEEAVHVKNILAKHDIKYISAFISGGEYKIPREDGTLIRGEDVLHVKVKIGYKA